MTDDITERVLSFWFPPPGPDGTRPKREEWFKRTDAFDAAIADQFTADCERALAGDLDRLMETPAGCLALIILLDQFPRNIFRGIPRAFASDAKAREVTRHVLERGFDQGLDMVERVFLYLPLEHSEDMADQDRMVELSKTLGDDNYVDYAIRHRDIVARFGRFPHRNATLGRESTAEELTFLEGPNSSF